MTEILLRPLFIIGAINDNTPLNYSIPHSASYPPVCPPQLLDVDVCSPEDFTRCIQLRNRTSLLAMDPRDIKYFDPEEVRKSEPQYDRLMQYVDTVMDTVKWRELDALDSHEREFYCATLDLIAAMCAGRNIVTQNIVRRFLPVDHILLGIDTIPLPTDDEDTASPSGKVAAAAAAAASNYSSGNGTPTYAMPQIQLHLKQAAAVLDPLRPIRTALLNVLFHCYIDSAMLPPIPMTGLDSVIRGSGSSTTDVDAEAESWDDVYIDEVFNH